MKLKKVNNQYVVSNPNLNQVNEMYLDSGGELDVEILLIDERRMSDKQRKFIFKLCQIVEDNTGQDKELFRAQAMAQNTIRNRIAKSSMSKYSMTDAKLITDIIIEYFVENEIHLPKLDLEENGYSLTEKQIYMMCLKRKCAICSKHADLHHYDHIGTKGSRHKVSHLGLRMLPLCRIHHTEAHSMAKQEFLDKYHLTPVVIDETLEYFIKRGVLKVIEVKEN